MSLLLNYSTQFTRYSAEYRLFGHITEYSAKNEYFPNIRIRPNILKNLGAECSYSAETEIPVSFEHWLRQNYHQLRHILADTAMKQPNVRSTQPRQGAQAGDP